MAESMTIAELVTKWGFNVDDKPLDRLDSSFKSLQKTIKRTAYVAGTIGVAVGGLLAKAIDYEQTQIAFETILKSAGTAKRVLADITRFAATTPFELPGLIANSKRLLAFKFQVDELIPTMQNLGNIAAGVGRDKLPTLVASLGKIRVKGRASLEELNMMLEAGVPILDALAERLGVNNETMFKMISQGKVGFKDVNKAIESLATGTGMFAGLMIKQSKSLGGLISNVQDYMGILARDLGMKLLPEAKKITKQFLEFLEVNQEMIKGKALNWLQSGIKFLEDIRDVSGSVLVVLNLVVSLFGGFDNVLKLALGTMSAMLAINFAHFLGVATQAVIALASGMKIFGNSALAAQLKAAIVPIAIGAAIIALGLVIEDFIGYFNGKDSFISVLINGFEKLGVIPKIIIRTMLTPMRLALNAMRSIAQIYETITGKWSFENFGNLAKNLGKNLYNGWFGGDTLGDAMGFNDSMKPDVITDNDANASMMQKLFYGMPTKPNGNVVNMSTKNEIVINKDMDEAQIKELVKGATKDALEQSYRAARLNVASDIDE